MYYKEKRKDHEFGRMTWWGPLEGGGGWWWDLAVGGGSHQNALYTNKKFSKNQEKY